VSDAVTDDVRADALIAAFDRAEEACGLRFDESVSLAKRADAIIRAAKEADLDPKLYQLVWGVRKWAKSASA
jgi:hypothetical protein